MSMRRVMDLLNRPMFGTKVIPRRARVDAARFSEQDFPLYCRNCDYLLRGLRDEICPECGQAFDRGRELVEQYARDPNRRYWKQTLLGRLTLMAAIGAPLLILASHFGALIYAGIIGLQVRSGGGVSGVTVDQAWETTMTIIFGLLLFRTVLLVVLIAAGVLTLYKYRQLRRRRRAVLEAIEGAEPSKARPGS